MEPFHADWFGQHKYDWLLRLTITIRFDSKCKIIAQLFDSIRNEKKQYSHSTINNGTGGPTGLWTELFMFDPHQLRVEPLTGRSIRARLVVTVTGGCIVLTMSMMMSVQRTGHHRATSHDTTTRLLHPIRLLQRLQHTDNMRLLHPIRLLQRLQHTDNVWLFHPIRLLQRLQHTEMCDSSTPSGSCNDYNTQTTCDSSTPSDSCNDYNTQTMWGSMV